MGEEQKGKKQKSVSILGPVILVALGTILLLNTLGTLDWDVWWDIVRLWPLLLIAIGLDLLIGRRSIWGGLVVALLVVGVLAGAVWLSQSGTAPSGMTGQPIEQPLGEATQAEVSLAPAIGELRLKALPEAANLVEGTVYREEGEEVEEDFSTQGNRATYTLKSGEMAWVPFGGQAGQRLWDLGLSPGVPLTLKVSSGVGANKLDLSGLTLDELTVNTGVGRTVVTLPAESSFSANISQGIGELVIVVPEGLGVRIKTSTALAARDLPADFVSAGENVYRSPGYSTAEQRVDLEAGIAIGKLTVRYAE